jgi:hypothetical protein
MKPLDSMFEKTAQDESPSLFGQLTTGLESNIGATFAQPKKEDIQLETLGEMFSPAHEHEMAGIRTQAMLSEFLSTDPVISTYDPDEVASAYNQVVQLAPRTAQQPAVMRGLLRKLLQQQDALEAFDADQLTQIEARLKQIHEPAQSLMTPYRGAAFESMQATPPPEMR